MTKRTIVVGAGVAGLAAGAAAAGSVDEVVILERDALPAEPRPRRGVPQGDQLHNLLTPAQRHLEALLPGFLAELVARGGVRLDVAADTEVFELGVRMPKRSVGLELYCAERPLIEDVLRRLLQTTYPNLVVRDEAAAEAVVLDEEGVCGIRLTTGEELDAEIVIDASGSGTRIDGWLLAAALPMPEIEVLSTGQWYVTASVQRPRAWRGVNAAWMHFPIAPATRGALVSPIGSDCWHISVSGRHPDQPPRSVEEVLNHLNLLGNALLLEPLRTAAFSSAPSVFRKTSATWRHHERLARPTPGLIPLGDAFASLNPLFGQGMSVAAWQSALLRRVLDARGHRSLSEITRAYLDVASGAIAVAWDLAADVAPSGARAARLAERIASDERVHAQHVRRWHLLEQPTR